ncbi:hypothetical protein [Amycolatopsis sp. H20-H5]|uniref:hypothetical protein n=1 Tax=Amycolatopsis sp. H20-H5 TaxID=3046309 RepID=UPI002DBC706D|nr:hypothetical protein [Amycolatopsis sp. H20-H5]MEC3980667.1 hypothetical protein [Amycolatopsis sp. H20-H5]
MPDLRIRLHRPDTDNAFRTRVKATADLPGGRTAGDFFTVALPPGAVEFTVTVEVTTPDGATVAEQVVQAFTLVSGVWKPQWAATNGAVRWTDRLHPRLTAVPAPVAGNIELRLDLTFVDMTRVIAGLSSAQSEYQQPHLTDPRNPDARNPHHGCLTYAFELTRAPVPKTWFVVVPPAAATQPSNPLLPRPQQPSVPGVGALTARTLDVLTFFRPSVDTTYSAVEKTPVAGFLGRYLIDPPVFAPFFARLPAEPVIPLWDRFPNVGLEGQLARSGKRVLLAMPWPSGGDYGAAQTPKLPGLLESLVLAAYSLGIVAAGNKLGATLGRMGIAGYSHGGDGALKAWLSPAVRRRCSELYLFDGNGTKQLSDNPRVVTEWFDQDRTRTLRMTGALQLDRMLGLATAVDARWRDELAKRDKDPRKNPPPTVWCRPGGTDFWSGRTPDSIYAWAFRLPPDPARPQDRRTYPPLPTTLAVRPASSELTAGSGVALNSPGTANAVSVSVVDNVVDNVVGNVAVTAGLSGVSPVELSGFTGSFWLAGKPPPARVVKQRQLAKFLTDAGNLLRFGEAPGDEHEADGGHGVRHQWAMCGGEGDPSRGAGFDGYFFLCLRDSGFASS